VLLARRGIVVRLKQKPVEGRRLAAIVADSEGQHASGQKLVRTHKGGGMES